ncbi:dihydropteroate synthase [Nitriliruptor alkaliphilus]|uniref:dihydropteroate synthase n=1 Tax=Nitriliruptor alkaliphilus TaxID=427918 RepID=UPI001B805AF5|nr:dihydropteroate synthase [Nitriliruptor alkaliphilus]
MAERHPDALSVPLFAAADRSAGDAAQRPSPVLDLPRRRIALGTRTAVMGIVNRTPDSFYDRGASFALDAAVARGRQLVAEGADIVDVGGVKGGPGDEVSVADELDRIVPFVEALRDAEPDVLLSVDTFRAPVADAALAAGADIVNDVTGLHDPEVLDVVVARQAGYVAMHHGGRPRTRPYRRSYTPDVTAAVVRHCAELTDRALAAGVPAERLIVDPGHDFQKTTAHSLELSRRLPELAALGFPVLVALSNKDFIGETLDAPLEHADGTPGGRRVDGSLAAAVFCILRGAHLVRVHEVRRTVDAVRMTEALLGWRRPAVEVRGLE